MLKTTFILYILILIGFNGCSYTHAAKEKADYEDVGNTGGIEYTLEKFSNKKYFLNITASPAIMETESSIAQRVHMFAVKYAAKTCPEKFEFIHDPNFDQKIASGFMKRTKSYLFICKN